MTDFETNGSTTGGETPSIASRYNGAVVIIPTRNRPDLAINAIRSVLRPSTRDVQVLVSDNSTEPQEMVQLERFCEQLRDSRLRYIKPPQPLAMTAHWDWAIHQAFELYEANHFIYLTDRMIFKTGEMKKLLRLAAHNPDKVIMYDHDRIADDESPIRIDQNPWTGKLFEIPSSRLLRLSSQMVLSPLPRMLNCIVPRCVLNDIEARFGNVFGSIAPDFNFCYRCLEIEASVLYWDKYPIAHYGLQRSNGASAAKGVTTRDSADFLAQLGKIKVNYAVPIPEITTVGNAIIHEYCVIQQETGSPKFPELNRAKYLEYLARETAQTQNPELRAQRLQVLKSHGWEEQDAQHSERKIGGENLYQQARRGVNQDESQEPAPTSPQGLSVSRLLNAVRWRYEKIRYLVDEKFGEPKHKPAWLFLRRYLGVRPPQNNGFVFDSVEQAIAYMNRFPRPREATLHRKDFLVD